MIILYNKEGRLGNKLLMLAHAIAYAREHNEKLLVLNFYKYSQYFKIKNKKIYVVQYKLLCILLLKCIILSNKIFKNKYFDIYQCGWVHTEIENLKRRKKILVLIGEGFRTKSLQKHKSYIKHIIKPNIRIVKKVNAIISSFFNSLERDKNIVIGLHLRKGDYKSWLNGKYFYTDNVYITIINGLKNIFPNDSLFFFACSDEILNIKEYVHYASNNNMYIDLMLLSSCNFIVGPPSTFSGYASFYGDVPIYFIEDPDKKICANDFKVHQL